MKDREKEIYLLMYEESQIIKKSKQKMKDLHDELKVIQDQKRIRRISERNNKKE